MKNGLNAVFIFLFGIAVCLLSNRAVAEDSSLTGPWSMKATMTEGLVTLDWPVLNDARLDHLIVFRSSVPTDMNGVSVARLSASSVRFADSVPDWTPYYYWVKAFDSKGAVLGVSEKEAAFAHPVDDPADRIETFAFWFEPYQRSIFKRIGHASFVVGTNDSAPVAKAFHKAGMGLLNYITFYQTSDWSGGYFQYGQNEAEVARKLAPLALYEKSFRFQGSPAGFAPSKFCRTGVEGFDPQAIRYILDPNSAALRQLTLAYVHKILARGISGFFVDNGYIDFIAASAVDQSTHEHYYGPQLTAADAFIGLLMEVYCELKKHDPHGIMIINGDVPTDARFYGLSMDDVSDGEVWENYLFNGDGIAADHNDNWNDDYKQSIEFEKEWQSPAPHRTYVLSYPWNKDEAFFVYATAKLCALPWSACLGVSDPDHKTDSGGHFGTYPQLVDLRLGAPVKKFEYGGQKLGEVYIRYYEKGFVLVNPTDKEQKFTVISLDGHSKCRDVYAQKDLTEQDLLLVDLPARSGRVYLYYR